MVGAVSQRGERRGCYTRRAQTCGGGKTNSDVEGGMIVLWILCDRPQADEGSVDFGMNSVQQRLFRPNFHRTRK